MPLWNCQSRKICNIYLKISNVSWIVAILQAQGHFITIIHRALWYNLKKVFRVETELDSKPRYIHSFIHPSAHSPNMLLDTSGVPNIILVVGDTAVGKAKSLLLWCSHFVGEDSNTQAHWSKLPNKGTTSVLQECPSSMQQGKGDEVCSGFWSWQSPWDEFHPLRLFSSVTSVHPADIIIFHEC